MTVAREGVRNAFAAVAAAAAMGLLWLRLVPWVLGLATGRTYFPWDTGGVFLAQLATCCGPLLLLALFAPLLRRAGVRRAIVAGIVVASLAWGCFYGALLVYRATGEQGGASIGLGLLMLASPLIAVVAMWAAYVAVRKDPASR